MIKELVKWWVKARFGKVDYQEYIHSRAWQLKRIRALRLADYKCQICYSEGPLLDAHHRTYERLGREKDSDLTILCRSCHSMYHGRMFK